MYTKLVSKHAGLEVLPAFQPAAMKGPWYKVSPRRNLLYSLVAAALVGLSLVIISGDNGLMDLFALRVERDRIVAGNEKTFNHNISLYRQIDRLKDDPRFIAATARKELGLVADDELIFKLK